MTWKLEAITGEFTGKEVNIDRDLLVGRHQDADLLLQSSDVSRRHAALLLKDTALYVQDLQSSNGTFVNDTRVTNEALLQQGDIVQFASHKFSVLAPSKDDITAPAEAPKQPVVETEIHQPSEAIATSETAQAEVAQAKSAAQQMNDQGMPDLKDRDANVQLSRDGMPQNVGIPKPAPIPEGVDVSKTVIEPKPTPVETPVSIVEQKVEEQKNASIGLMALIVLIVIAIIAWLVFK